MCMCVHVDVSRYLSAVRTNTFEHVSVFACVGNKMSVCNGTYEHVSQGLDLQVGVSERVGKY